MKNPGIAIAALALCAACATPRKDLGEIQVKTARPILSTQLFDYANFRVEEGRLFATSPGGPMAFDVSVMDDGCLRGTSRGQHNLHICPAGKAASEDGVRFYRTTGRGILAFSTQLKDGGRTLEIEAGSLRAGIELGDSPAHHEIRRHPELLGAAFASQMLPASRNEPGSDWHHREWKYVVTMR